MGVKVTRGDLEKASSTVRSGCDNISSNAKLATQSIEAFIQDSYQTLTGSGFDYVRSKMSLFLSATEKLVVPLSSSHSTKTQRSSSPENSKIMSSP